MIQVLINRGASDRRIQSFAVDGHAGFAEPGKDIVCAAVSAVTTGTVNAAESVLDVMFPCTVKKGRMRVSVPEIQEQEKAKQVQLLLESMVVMLQTIEGSYGEYITIKQNE